MYRFFVALMICIWSFLMIRIFLEVSWLFSFFYIKFVAIKKQLLSYIKSSFDI